MSDEGGEPACYLHLVEQLEDLATRADIDDLLGDFSRLVASDDLLDPLSADAIDQLGEFLMSELFGAGAGGRHPLATLHPEHRQRWVELFTQTVDLDFAGPLATAAKHAVTSGSGFIA